MIFSFLLIFSLLEPSVRAATSVTFYTDTACQDKSTVASVPPSIFNVQCQGFPLQGVAVGSVLLTDWDSDTTVTIFGSPSCGATGGVYLAPGFCKTVSYAGGGEPAIEVVVDQSSVTSSSGSGSASSTTPQQSTAQSTTASTFTTSTTPGSNTLSTTSTSSTTPSSPTEVVQSHDKLTEPAEIATIISPVIAVLGLGGGLYAYGRKHGWWK